MALRCKAITKKGEQCRNSVGNSLSYCRIHSNLEVGTESDASEGEGAESDLSDLSKDILLRLLEYCRYLYDEEKERTNRIEKKIDVFKIYLSGGVLVSLILPFGEVHSFVAKGVTIHPLGTIITSFYALSIFMFLSSFVFTVLIYKVEQFESPAESSRLVDRALSAKDEQEFISTIIADYSIAASRNHIINDKKAVYLSKAFFSFFMAVILVIVSLLLSKAISVMSGGI